MAFADLGVVIVLYNPDTVQVLRHVQLLLSYVGCVCMVDNTPEQQNEELECFSKQVDALVYIPLRENKGIASALNVGMERVFQKKEWVLLLDQDSEASEEMIRQLFIAYNTLQQAGVTHIAAVGPQAINKRSKNIYTDREQLNKRYIADGVVKKTEIMTSGSLIRREAYLTIGPMDEGLFIDGVDSEWCWRAASKGFASYMSEHATLQHMLGEGDHRFMFMDLAISSPTRCYYQFRNYLVLCRKDYTPWGWKVLNGVKYLVKLFYYPIVLKNRYAYLYNIFSGIRDGINNKQFIKP